MPIKLFARRKSSGYGLEGSDSPPSEPSFRVLPRRDEHEEYHKKPGSRPNSLPVQRWGDDSYDGGPQLTRRTHNSSSTENTSYSDRHSYHSTQPSSIHSRSQDSLASEGRKSQEPLRQDGDEEDDHLFGSQPSPHRNRFTWAPSTAPPLPSPLQTAGNRSVSPTKRDGVSPVGGRDRSKSTSSYSSYASTQHTARPGLGPTIRGSGDSDSEGSWPLPSGRTPIMEEPEPMQLPQPPKPAARLDSDSKISNRSQPSRASEEIDERQSALPLSVRLHNARAAVNSPDWQEDQLPPPKPLFSRPEPSFASDSVPRRSWESNASEQGFLSRGHNRNNSGSREVVTPQQRSPVLRRAESPLRQDSPSSPAYLDNQALLDTLAASQAFEQQYAPQPAQNLPERPRPGATVPNLFEKYSTPVDASQEDSLVSSNATTPRAQGSTPNGNENVRRFTISRRGVPNRPSILPLGTRVMSKAEFETYKNTSTAAREDDEKSQKSDESDKSDDEDEAERNRQTARQRRKQEAHLSVYRQQMMKVTGEQPDLASATRAAGSPSTQSLNSLDPNIVKTNNSSPKMCSDEDDDVPLGVLQAHGFPSKSRPPTRMSTSGPSPSRSASNLAAYPSPPGATKNDTAAGGGGRTDLPPFARNLPKDPYVGASLYNQPIREPLTRSSHPSTSLPPGGLIGVIDAEEKAKAARRGSANAYGTYGGYGSTLGYGMGGLSHSGQVPWASGMPFMPSQQQQQSQDLQQQLEMNRQMTQMMQMQMQMMQQMMVAQGMQFPPGMMPMQQGQPGQQSGMQQQQPYSFLDSPYEPHQQPRNPALSTSASMTDLRHQGRRGSAMSLHPNRASSGFPTNRGGAVTGPSSTYAPSIAPSERSNVDQPTRYRPVTPAFMTPMSRDSPSPNATATAISRPRSRSPHKLDLPSPGQGLGAVVNPPTTIRAISKPRKGMNPDSGDEEDDAAWEEMKKRRDERRSRWSARKKEKEAAEMPNEGLEGLYYDG